MIECVHGVLAVRTYTYGYGRIRHSMIECVHGVLEGLPYVHIRTVTYVFVQYSYRFVRIRTYTYVFVPGAARRRG